MCNAKNLNMNDKDLTDGVSNEFLPFVPSLKLSSE